jgi:hypothetical protein
MMRWKQDAKDSEGRQLGADSEVMDVQRPGIAHTSRQRTPCRVQVITCDNTNQCSREQLKLRMVG